MTRKMKTEKQKEATVRNFCHEFIFGAFLRRNAIKRNEKTDDFIGKNTAKSGSASGKCVHIIGKVVNYMSKRYEIDEQQQKTA